MSKFIIVVNNDEIIDVDKNWELAKFKKTRVEYEGRNYRVITKYHRNFSTCEKVGRVLLGFTLSLLTGSILYFKSKTVRNLFKDYSTIRYGVLEVNIGQPVAQPVPLYA